MSEETNVKLNIKSIIRFEQLTNKSFFEFDDKKIDDIKNLLYCIVLMNNEEVFNLDSFNLILSNKKRAKEIVTKFNKILEINELFTPKVEVKQDDKIEDVETINEKVYVKDIASQLIINAGMDASYVMNELSIIDFTLFATAYQNKMKNDADIINYKLNFDRLWTWFNIIYQVGMKNLENPQKLFLFPWETDIIETKEIEEIKQIDMEQFIKDGQAMIQKITKQNN